MPDLPRQSLPRPSTRLPLGATGLRVSPLCLGITTDPQVIPAAFEAGINFFFVSADVHWPKYEGIRRGLGMLLARPGVREQIVVGVVSYLADEMFRHLQFNEVIDAVPGLRYIDLMIVGAVAGPGSLSFRSDCVRTGRNMRLHGAQATGASFHDRKMAAQSLLADELDIHYIRYNAAHWGARVDIFPHLARQRRSLLYNFKSMVGYHEAVTAARRLGSAWNLHPTDAYRFALSNPHIDGVLFAPGSPGELQELVRMLEGKPFTPAEQELMMILAAAGSSRTEAGQPDTKIPV
jgi:hypothetical protein